MLIALPSQEVSSYFLSLPATSGPQHARLLGICVCIMGLSLLSTPLAAALRPYGGLWKVGCGTALSRAAKIFWGGKEIGANKAMTHRIR